MRGGIQEATLWSSREGDMNVLLKRRYKSKWQGETRMNCSHINMRRESQDHFLCHTLAVECGTRWIHMHPPARWVAAFVKQGPIQQVVKMKFQSTALWTHAVCRKRQLILASAIKPLTILDVIVVLGDENLNWAFTPPAPLLRIGALLANSEKWACTWRFSWPLAL